MFRIRIWDLPTRLFHWSLAALVTAMFITSSLGGGAMVWHMRCGYAIFFLLLFRLMWGFVGGRWSRWSSAYMTLRQLPSMRQKGIQKVVWAGHSPMGWASVMLMLSFLSLQVGTGLFTDDEIAYAGPLVQWVASSTVSAATYWHKHIGKLSLLALIMLHLAAIAWYRFKAQQNLIPPMLGGDKVLPESVSPSNDRRSDWLTALACCLLAAACVYALLLWSAGLPISG